MLGRRARGGGLRFGGRRVADLVDARTVVLVDVHTDRDPDTAEPEDDDDRRHGGHPPSAAALGGPSFLVLRVVGARIGFRIGVGHRAVEPDVPVLVQAIVGGIDAGGAERDRTRLRRLGAPRQVHGLVLDAIEFVRRIVVAAESLRERVAGQERGEASFGECLPQARPVVGARAEQDRVDGRLSREFYDHPV
ncbi:hypothetical protein ACFOJ6_08250 [Gordonia humi]|uniref:hypothetical protein n=1 Tax=Gordonia humi TaxID=686429 RepID=UPI003617C00D